MNSEITVIYNMITAHRIINLLSKSIYLSYIRDDGSHYCLAVHVIYWSSLSRLFLVYMLFCLLTQSQLEELSARPTPTHLASY